MKAPFVGGLLASMAAVALGAQQPSAPPARPQPVSDETSVLCSPLVLPVLEDMSLRIAGSEEGTRKRGLAPGDRLYLGRGQADGLARGSRWQVRRDMGPVTDPGTRRTIGHAVRTLGWVQVETLTEHRSIARIERGCDTMYVGDYLRPYEEVGIPSVVIPHALTDAIPTGVRGYLIYSQDRILGLGTGHFINVDLGSESGVKVGDRLTIFRVVYPRLDTPPKVLGEAVVLRATSKTATAKIIVSRDAMYVGDQVAKQ